MLTGHSDFIAQWALTDPSRIALSEVETGRTLRYGQLNERAWRLVHALAAQGVQPGDRVALIARNGIETFELVVACLRLGAAFTPLNWRLAVPELADIVDRCHPKALVYDQASREAAGALLETRQGTRGVALGEPARAGDHRYEDLLQRASATPDFQCRGPEQLAMLLYTSGTTGKPKGVMVPHRQVFWNAVNTVFACDLNPNDRVLAFLPLFHTGGLNCLATPTLYRGGTVVLMGGFDPVLSLKVIEQQRITATVAVPTMYHMLLDAGVDTHDLSSVHTWLSGGAAAPEPLLDAWLDRGFTFRQGYGMTEVGPNCFSLPPHMIHLKRGTVGQPILHAQAAVFDEADRMLGVGEVGELRLAGPHVCQGYWDDPENSHAANPDGWFRTGDYAQFDAQGFFRISGRKKDMFISGGENVYPAEIENVVLGFEGVDEVAVVGEADAKWGEVGVAVIVPRPGRPVDLAALEAHCRGSLAKFKVPKRFVLADGALPKNASG
ncbi:MAG: AMP-binding protein, partial [Myxococcales bacterium]|nr:AMP-binding protein [Myxococcales bacterium]